MRRVKRMREEGGGGREEFNHYFVPFKSTL